MDISVSIANGHTKNITLQIPGILNFIIRNSILLGEITTRKIWLRYAQFVMMIFIESCNQENDGKRPAIKKRTG